MSDTYDARPARNRFDSFFDRAETIYLRVLRITILIIATLLILYTAYLALTGLYSVVQSPDSVKEVAASVVANEIVDAEEAEQRADAESRGPVSDPAEQKFYARFVDRYYELFRTKFEPFRQTGDKILSRDEFDDNFVQSAARLEASTNGEIVFAKDSADLEALLSTMTAATAEPKTVQRLQRYKQAKKVAVQREVRRTRTEYRQGWNSYSTNCNGWYLSPIGCSERRAVQVPYTDKVTTMEFPKGTQSHAQIFRAMQDKYFDLLGTRRADNAADAERRRMEIVAGNISGEASLGTALRIFGGFIALMFFFLLIAIERHQRRIAALVPVQEKEEYAAG